MHHTHVGGNFRDAKLKLKVKPYSIKQVTKLYALKLACFTSTQAILNYNTKSYKIITQ